MGERPVITRQDDEALVVSVGDVELFEYVFRPSTPAFEGPKPYLHPVRTLAGDVVTAFRPHDHRWHKGLQMTATDVSGENFWGGNTYVRDQGYLALPNVGTMRHEDFTVASPEGEVRIDELLSWFTESGQHWVREMRQFTVRDVEDDSWTLDFATTLTNLRAEPLVFGSPTTNGRELAGYTGFFWRGPRSFTDGQVIAADGGAGQEMMGRAARWLAFVGHHDEVERSSTMLFLDHPDNKGTHWFVRSAPFAAVNPSFAFFEPVEVAPGEALTLRYRLVVANGEWNRDRLESYVEVHPW
ncbi:Methane oxygenase PmoA [Lentzea albidocapillata subsp. violacea]|uniref:Methane oxygenase PmoA n=1 Tax=Lentzea albidocapillata subsp. violacea TaxID=128104 RepID=A0A1G8PNJ3_9PSEU|nr:PmoA family protein [Lentzea albidocapillata]SDI94159.1 Methane oxygenase PmoA [Lentzea albidocapillata subsp. violacea]